MTQHDRIFKEWVNSSNNLIPPRTPNVFGMPQYEFPGSPPTIMVNEKDPSGKALNEPGAKADAGKLRGHLCLAGFARALRKVAEVTTVGAVKYTPNGWAEVENGYERYMDAFVRHYLDFGTGKKIDDGPNGTGCEHIAQMIWNLLAAYELSLRQVEKNRD